MMESKKLIVALGLLLTASICADALPSPSREAPKNVGPSPVAASSFDITTDDLNDDENNNVLLYDPVAPKQIDYKSTSDSREKYQSGSFMVVERESVPRGLEIKPATNLKVAESRDVDAERSGSPSVEMARDIALNAREVRLVGPNQREVEMKDDLPTKVVVALENLQKEAKQVYGQVNEKLDKGWTELKNSEVWSQMNDKLDRGWTEVKKAEVWSQINDKLDKGWTDLKGMVEGVVNSSAAGKSG